VTRFRTSRGAKVLVVAAAATGGLLIGGVANADTSGGSPDTGTGSPVGGLLGGTGGLDVGGLVGPILGGGAGGALGLDPLGLVGPVLQPILGGLSGAPGGLLSGQDGTTGLLGGLFGRHGWPSRWAGPLTNA
jgi:hypothetical protein